MIIRCTIAGIVSALLSARALAGPLNPPAGAVGETGRFGPRTEVNAANTPGDADSLFKITQPGSYYFAQNIDASPNMHGIEIAIGGVTLDLNGFKLTGSANSLDAVNVSAGLPVNIVIMNGQIDSWGQDGVDAGGALAARIENVNVVLCLGTGIRAGQGCLVESCATAFNSFGGIHCAGENCVVRNCSSYQNGGGGVIVGQSSKVANCCAFGNAGNGVSIGFGSQVANCASRQNGASGFSLGNGCLIVDCVAYDNDGDGIAAFSGSVVTGCSTYLNTGDGIQVTSECLVINNNCTVNGNGGEGAGVHATNTGNRIDGNDCTGNDAGVAVDAEGNIIIRNTATGNAVEFDLAPNNTAGPILNSAGLTITSSSPWANIIY